MADDVDLDAVPERASRWKLEGNEELHLSRNVGGTFRLHNNFNLRGKKDELSAEIRLVTNDPHPPDNPANHIKPGRTIFVKIAAESDLVIALFDSSKTAEGWVELVTS